jgi:Flp pilus assembly protein TadB
MNLWVVVAGVLAGLGVFLAVRELLPARVRLDAALARLEAEGGPVPPASARRARLIRRLDGAAPWLPVPAADLALLGQDRESWLASKMICGLLGLAALPFFDALLALAGHTLPVILPVAGSVTIGLVLFFAPDLVTRVNAAQKRADFRHALASYLDLVSLERGAGAAPTESLESAAAIGGGWAFERIDAALSRARVSGRAPWDGLAELAGQTGIAELGDLADIAGIAGQEGGKIIDTLTARAASMRAEAVAASRGKAGSRSTTMVVPIALLGFGFLLLLVFPIIYRTFIAG